MILIVVRKSVREEDTVPAAFRSATAKIRTRLAILRPENARCLVVIRDGPEPIVQVLLREEFKHSKQDFIVSYLVLAECADGYFGQHCEYDCKCHSPNEVCDKYHGTCDNGCAPGWQGSSCRQGEWTVKNKFLFEN